MKITSVNDVAIRLAYRRGTLSVAKHYSERLGLHYWAIEDDAGLIEICSDETEANTIVARAKAA